MEYIIFAETLLRDDACSQLASTLYCELDELSFYNDLGQLIPVDGITNKRQVPISFISQIELPLISHDEKIKAFNLPGLSPEVKTADHIKNVFLFKKYFIPELILLSTQAFSHLPPATQKLFDFQTQRIYVFMTPEGDLLAGDIKFVNIEQINKETEK